MSDKCHTQLVPLQTISGLSKFPPALVVTSLIAYLATVVSRDAYIVPVIYVYLAPQMTERMVKINILVHMYINQ